MINVGVVDFLNMNIIETKRFICGVCGKFLDIIEYVLDDEEMISEIENYDELKNTIIHKEMKKIQDLEQLEREKEVSDILYNERKSEITK